MSLREATAPAAVTVVSPSGRQERVPVHTEGTDRRVFFDGTLSSGVYRVEIGDDRSATQLVAVNIDTRESDPARIDSNLLPAPFAEPQAIEVAAAAAPAARISWPLFRGVLGALLLLLLTESVLAWRFGGAAG